MVAWKNYDENTKGPCGGYGIQTGHYNGIFVVDLDISDQKNGIEAILSLGNIPGTLSVLTPSGGVHLYFRLPSGVHVPTTRGVIAPGVDIKGEGGFVVGPGSPHKSGGLYQEVSAPLVDAPDWLMELVTRPLAPTKPAPTEHYTVDPESPEGVRAVTWARNYLATRAEPAIEGQGGSNVFYGVCCHITHSALPLDALRILVEEVYNPRCVPPWSLQEIDHKLQDADRREGQLPRGLAPEGFLDRMYGRTRVLARNNSGQLEPTTPAEVVDQLASHGPAIHIPTGLEALDKLTGGGPRLGDLVGILGAPDAAKTLLCVAFADHWVTQACVGMLCVDEDEEGIVTRLAQRRGWKRPEVERRERFGELRAKMPSLYIYDGAWRLEDAIDDLAKRSDDRPVILICDSLQTIAECSTDASDETQTHAVTRTLATLRTAARELRWLVVFTSEMVRAAYNGDARTSSLAAAKWSGSIEYASKLLLALRPIEGDLDHIEAEIAKNKLGPHGKLRLRLDRAAQKVSVAQDAPEAVGRSVNDNLAKNAMRIVAFLSARGGHFEGNKSALQKAIGMQRTAFFDAISTLEGSRIRVVPASHVAGGTALVALRSVESVPTDRTTGVRS
jgi:hypothetical protein